MIVESIDDVIYLSGELTTNQWEAIRTAAGLVLKRHPQGVVVDCSGLTSVSKAGAETFFYMMKYIQQKNARIIVANVPENVRAKLMEVEDVRSGLAIADSIEDARQSLELLETIGAPNGKKVHATGSLLLSISGGAADSNAISLAAAISEMRQLSVVIVFPIVVPQALPTTQVMPEQEDEAAEVLQRAVKIFEAQQIAVEPTVERVRNTAAAIEKVAKDRSPRTVVVALPQSNPQTGEPIRTIEEVLSKIKSEIVFVREAKK